MNPSPAAPAPSVYRHALATRIWHWVNAVAVFVLIGSGLGISNAHPRLYWGRYGANFDHAWASLPRFPAWITIPPIVPVPASTPPVTMTVPPRAPFT